MCILDIKSTRDTSHSVPPPAPPPPPPPQNSIVSVSDTDSESETDSESDTAITPPAVAVAFDLTTMTKYLYTPNVKNDTLLWCAYIMIHGIE